ncbi:hypothetical protein AB4043_22645 [Terriglobus sp. YAF25]|uniref:hypothetical protein n=1 Tax=Terriglobus sp. YAF25 TaxID=3233080 RepID=UPI003F952D6D
MDRHIRNRTDEVTEQQIGILVFDRKAGYDSNEDNIVRSYARNLRRRIDDYYAKEGKDESLRLDIPRGGYVPYFTDRSLKEETQPQTLLSAADTDLPAAVPEAESLPQENPQVSHDPPDVANRPVKPGLLWVLGTAAALCLGLIVGLAIPRRRSLFPAKDSIATSSARAASSSFWRQVFPSNGETYVVPSDDGLVIMQRLTERPVPLASYINGDYRKPKQSSDNAADTELLKLGARRYTSVVDLDFVSHLSQLEEVNAARMVVRYARDLRMDDLRTGNAVLIGSIESNPWIQLFASQMNFRQVINTDPSKPSGLLNAHPQPGERELYGTPGKDHTYGLIAFVPNLNSTGHVLIVGGLNTAGTQAATTFLLTPALMASALAQARDANGHLHSFELLIEANSFAANASAPQLVAERIYKN